MADLFRMFDAKPTPRRGPAHLSRASDPPESSEAAADATARHMDQKAADIVASVMADGKARIDEEIHAAAIEAGHRLSVDRVRHGRKLLADLGRLAATGERRFTSRGSKSREWKIVDGGEP